MQNALDVLESGDWITSINGTSTFDKDKTFIERVKYACYNDFLILVLRKPVEYQEFNLWDPNQVTISIRAGLKELPFGLDIFHPDLNHKSKTYALVDEIFQQKIDLKGLKRGDKVIAINEHILQDKTYKELQHIIHRLHPQQQIMLTIESRQWRQYGYLTRHAIDSPAGCGWRGLQAELKKSDSKMNYGFMFKFVENPLEQPCAIITQIVAGHTPAAVSQYLNPGCKITAINGQAVKGLSFHEVKTKLERAKTSVVLSIEEPTRFLYEGNSLPSSNSSSTWPVETQHGFLHKSLSEGQIHYANSFQAYKLPSIDLTGQQKEQATSNVVYHAKSKPLFVCGSLPTISDYNKGLINEEINDLECSGIHQEPGTPLFVSLQPHDHETPTDQDMPVCQNCLPSTISDKREQTIEHIPGKTYHSLCTKLDMITCFYDDYRLLGEKLGFPRQEISNLNRSNQPTHDLLSAWIKRKGDGATIQVLLDVLLEMGRHDLWQLLQSWAENSTKHFEYQQVNLRESCV
ncbi:uncharacterized protein LOC110062991 [Orbicella faveolata]|uniref:uncharacterized protein LOC110062991 n=1 Tax=Orbicella faveolata TaxID=48498 RepID=UPI0009E2414F|nr:uncharacterized protein LOC110062991 [Orbicella faveolata]